MYQLRLATAKDAAQIASVYRPFVENTAISFEAFPPDDVAMAQRIEEALEGHSWWVCTFHKRVIGYAYAGALRTRDAYRFTAEASVYIAPEHHRKGIARALYTLIHSVLQLQGFKNCYAGMTAPNPASKAFHESMGYTRMATYQNVGYKNGAWHSTEWFHRPLSPTNGIPAELRTLQEIPAEQIDRFIAEASQLLRQGPTA